MAGRGFFDWLLNGQPDGFVAGFGFNDYYNGNFFVKYQNNVGVIKKIVIPLQVEMQQITI